MDKMMNLQKISPLKIAQEQLEEAIILHIEKRKFFSSLTLAGAAEEILGKTLPAEKQNAQNELINNLQTAYPDLILKEDGKPLSELTHSDMHQHLNGAKNKFKHTVEDYEGDPEEESKILLIRALANFCNHKVPVNLVIAKGIEHFFPDLSFDENEDAFRERHC